MVAESPLYIEFVLLFTSGAFVAGFFNALAGGGTFFILPILLSLGVPPIVANATSVSSLTSGYVGSAYQYREQIKAQSQHLWLMLSVALLGSFIGAIILTEIDNKLFAKFIPFLVLLATVSFSLSNRSMSGVGKYTQKASLWSIGLYLLVCLYGGFFGAGMGIMIMAILPLFGVSYLQHNLALKHIISLTTSLTALMVFIWADLILWPYMLLGLIGATLGGWIGAKFSQRMNNTYLMSIVVIVGTLLSVYYFYLYWIK